MISIVEQNRMWINRIKKMSGRRKLIYCSESIMEKRILKMLNQNLKWKLYERKYTSYKFTWKINDITAITTEINNPYEYCFKNIDILLCYSRAYITAEDTIVEMNIIGFEKETGSMYIIKFNDFTNVDIMHNVSEKNLIEKYDFPSYVPIHVIFDHCDMLEEDIVKDIREDNAIRKIQKATHNWLWKPGCGINCSNKMYDRMIVEFENKFKESDEI